MSIFTPIEGRSVDNIERSHVAIMQRRWMSLLAFTFPLVFLVSSFLLGRTEFQSSISAYYWTLDPERNLFIGMLCFIGAYLILYRGLTWIEDRALDVGGLCAVGVALFPAPEEGGLSAHYGFAIFFFACIFYVGIFMSRRTLPSLEPAERRFFRICYMICSSIMVGVVVIGIVLFLLPKELRESITAGHLVFWLEAIGIWAFSAYWYTKSRELDPKLSFVPFKEKKAS
jgi:hypothetical protein